MPETRPIKFHKKSNQLKLLEFEPMRDLAPDRIDEAVIEHFKFWALRRPDETSAKSSTSSTQTPIRFGYRQRRTGPAGGLSSSNV